ncbi:MAG: monovalent cation/H+ antiporter subunit D family protein [Clostridia bacterium]|nr:monovalent cation/H+ antiporter subunit D family protein [Clostridia bacterium]
MPQKELVTSVIPALIVLAPLLCTCGVMFADRYRPEWRNVFIIAGSLLPFLMVVYIYPSVMAGNYHYQYINILPPIGMEFRVDTLSIYIGLLFGFFSLIISIYTLGYYHDKEEGKKFYYFLMPAFAGCFGVALSGNMITFFLFFEFMSLMFFPLVSYKSTPEAHAAGLKFFFMTIISGVALFWAVAITYNITGDLSFGAGGLITTASPMLLVAFICYLISFGIKASLIPLHFWMPDAYAAAPTPAATLSSVMMLKAGVLGLIRMFHDIYGISFIRDVGWNKIVLVLAIISMLYGSICALSQDNLNRRLAYSGIAQIGYILLGLALLTEQAFVGAIYHIMTHAFMKGCLFLCAGVIYVNTGKQKISEMRGIGLQMPVIMSAFTVAAVSSVGVPPFNLFVSKWHLGLGALDAGMPLIIVVLLLSSILNASYYFPISINAFLGCRELKNIERQRLHLQPLRIGPVIILALGAFAFTLAPTNWPLNLARAIAQIYF